MWLLGGGAARPPAQTTRGPAILSTPDGAMPQVQCITPICATAPRKRGLAVSDINYTSYIMIIQQVSCLIGHDCVLKGLILEVHPQGRPITCKCSRSQLDARSQDRSMWHRDPAVDVFGRNDPTKNILVKKRLSSYRLIASI